MPCLRSRVVSGRLPALGGLAVVLILFCLPSEAAAFSYVALGDSLAAGVGDTSGGYVARYADDVAADLALGVALQNLAVSGSTSGDLLATLTSDAGVRAAVAGADLVTLDIGGNDVLRGIFAFKNGTCGGADGQDCLRQAIADVDANWPSIGASLRALNAAAMMRTMTYYNSLIVDLEPGDGTASVAKRDHQLCGQPAGLS